VHGAGDGQAVCDLGVGGIEDFQRKIGSLGPKSERGLKTLPSVIASWHGFSGRGSA